MHLCNQGYSGSKWINSSKIEQLLAQLLKDSHFIPEEKPVEICVEFSLVDTLVSTVSAKNLVLNTAYLPFAIRNLTSTADHTQQIVRWSKINAVVILHTFVLKRKDARVRDVCGVSKKLISGQRKKKLHEGVISTTERTTQDWWIISDSGN